MDHIPVTEFMSAGAEDCVASDCTFYNCTASSALLPAVEFHGPLKLALIILAGTISSIVPLALTASTRLVTTMRAHSLDAAPISVCGIVRH